MWECQFCHHLNKDEVETCEECGARKNELTYEEIDDDLREDEDLELF